MGVYSVRGFSPSFSGNTDDGFAHLWNPDTAQRLRVIEFGYHNASAGTSTQRFRLFRTTGRGTPGSTVTPDADNAWDVNDSPPSGALLDLAVFTIQPTKADPGLQGIHHSTGGTGTPGTGFVYRPDRPLWVPPGTGLLLAYGSIDFWPSCEVYVVWYEQ